MSIVVSHVSHGFDQRDILRRVSLRLGPEDRVGLVGPNGEGKTTLLRVLAGSLTPDAGEVQRPQGLRIGYLPQDPPAPAEKTVRQSAMEAFADVRALEAELAALAEKVSAPDADDALLHRYGALQHELETRGGYDYQRETDRVLEGLGFDRTAADRPLAQLSGGQRTRAFLARILLGRPDVLLLDEPTNHLDIDSVEWLERWLEGFAGAVVVVSHDRYFLDRVTRHTWEVRAGAVEAYKGSYSRFVEQRAERFLQREREYEAQQDYIRRTREFIAQHISGQRTKEAQGRRTRLERFLREEALDPPQAPRAIHVSLPAGRRTGDRVLLAEGLQAGYEPGKPLVSTERIEVTRGQRIAIVGANGAGKTTLLRTLRGELPPLAGQVKHGANVEFGTLSQTHAELDASATALDSVTPVAGRVERARDLLGALLLRGEDVHKKVSELSGGQRSRVILARLMARGANVLLLDEPTNHLDIPSTEILEDALRRFDGTVLLVSHDRYFVQAVATDIWAIRDGRVQRIRGGWEAYLAWRAERDAGEGQAFAAGAAEAAQSKQDRKQAFQEGRRRANRLQTLRRRHDELENLIHRAEGQLEELSRSVSSASEEGDLRRVETLGNEYQQVQGLLDDLMKEWETVGEEIGQLESQAEGP